MSLIARSIQEPGELQPHWLQRAITAVGRDRRTEHEAVGRCDGEGVHAALAQEVPPAKAYVGSLMRELVESCDYPQSQMNVDERIQRAWANGNLIPVVGAGVSAGAAGLPNWKGMLEAGIVYLSEHRRELNLEPDSIAAVEAVSKAGRLVEGLGLLEQLLGGQTQSYHYQAFLNEQFAEPIVKDPRALEALRHLRPRVVVTTNYDLLLRDSHVLPQAEIATWLEPQRILSILRGSSGIIHLHGRYDLLKSVILSDYDYGRIVHRDQDSIAVAQALFHAGVLLFVGCSLDSVSDKHLSTLLKEFERLQGFMDEGTTPHFLLARKGITQLQVAKLKRLGIVPVIYGDDFSHLADYLNAIPARPTSSVPTEEVRTRLKTLRGAQSLDEVCADIRTFIEQVVYPGRRIRMGLAVKMRDGDRIILRNRYLLPAAATHNDFDYPATLASWALVEGRIFTIPGDWDRPCDFKLLRKLKKFDRVQADIAGLDPERCQALAEYLSIPEVRQKAHDETLTIRDIYTNWVGRQPTAHYHQFVSVPVPVVDTTNNLTEPPEYGTLNIDTMELEPLLTETSAPLLKLASDMLALAFSTLAPREENPA